MPFELLWMVYLCFAFVGSLVRCTSTRQWSAATFGMHMTNNKGPQVRLAWAYRAVLCDREDLGQ